ncbi:unnamed protein product [Camellia sinensis]
MQDILKGSFYANPIFDTPTTDESLVQRYPSYCGSNIWPDRALPELEVAFKALGKLILDVGLMVAYHCDRYARRRERVAAEYNSRGGMKMHEDEGLEQILLRSRCHKVFIPKMVSLCHLGVGGTLIMVPSQRLTRGMFMRDAVELPCPDSAAGLYIKTRNDQIVKVVFGEDEIAYQIGETTEILSRGHLCATPHCVRAPKGEEASGIERSTFALFMQPDCRPERLEVVNAIAVPQLGVVDGADGDGPPVVTGSEELPNSKNQDVVNFVGCISDGGGDGSGDGSGGMVEVVVVWWDGGGGGGSIVALDEKLNFPEVVHIHQELISSYGSLTFGEYTEKLLDKYYHLKA